MSEIEAKSNAISENGFFIKLANGDYGLPITYWVFGVLVQIAFVIFMGLANVFLQLKVSTMTLVYLLNTIYFILQALGTWRAANIYSGNKIWAILAKMAVVIGATSHMNNWEWILRS